MSKIVIIGIDGLDPFLLDEWKEELPNIGQLFNDVSDITAESTFPPDSICAWTSIFTGENPAEHGLIESIDYLSSKKISEGKDRSTHFKGKTFWDIAGKNGKTVCVINPFIAYPAWEVNGVMISGPVFEGGEVSTYPDGIINEYEFPPLGGMVDFPDEKDLGEFINHTRDMTKQLADASLKIFKDHNPDLFFLTFLTMDRIKHFLWRFTDKDDIYYPGNNLYENAIKDFYIMFDKIIGMFSEAITSDTSLLIISDHGHRRRCSKCLNLNEILRKKGYLEIAGNGASGALKKLVEKTKVFTISSLSRFGLQDWIYKIAKIVPGRKALKTSTYLINKDNSTVTLSYSSPLSNFISSPPYGFVPQRLERVTVELSLLIR
jgi:predicted AlkP superfamily phosphohydrolase/phosphomutase